jgi:SAM-dependent methyltransferase
MNLNRVWLHAYGFNERAIACYKCGFVVEGTLRKLVPRRSLHQHDHDGHPAQRFEAARRTAVMSRFYDPIRYDAATTQKRPGRYRLLHRAGDGGARPVSGAGLACGTGRVAIPIAREGVRVVGLDLTASMLDRAREKSAEIENICWVEGDMRVFSLPERFGLIFIPNRSFQHCSRSTISSRACVASARISCRAVNKSTSSIGHCRHMMDDHEGGLQRHARRSGRRSVGGAIVRLARREVDDVHR